MDGCNVNSILLLIMMLEFVYDRKDFKPFATVRLLTLNRVKIWENRALLINLAQLL